MFKFYTVKSLKPNPHSVQARLPAVYTEYVKALKLPQTPVHYIPETEKYTWDSELHEKRRLENREIPLKFPVEADQGIWGGEGVIKGMIKEIKNRRPLPKYWVPKLKKAVVYSEIFNQYMELTVTERTLHLIDQYTGFDHYILGSPVQDLKSQLALSIRRKMLLALVNKEKLYEDEETNQEIHEKYKKYMIPKEEAEWFGLTMREAVQKQRLIEDAKVPVPLKHELRAKYIDQLKRGEEPGTEKGDEPGTEEEAEKSEEKSWISKLNPFSR